MKDSGALSLRYLDGLSCTIPCRNEGRDDEHAEHSKASARWIASCNFSVCNHLCFSPHRCPGIQGGQPDCEVREREWKRRPWEVHRRGSCLLYQLSHTATTERATGSQPLASGHTALLPTRSPGCRL